MVFLYQAPLHPSPSDIFDKIIPWPHGPLSTTEQIEIDIDLSLFPHDYGFVHHYMIYVRQGKLLSDMLDRNDTFFLFIHIPLIDQWRFYAVPYMNGTYGEAWNNPSVDYLAAVISVYSRNMQCKYR